MELVIIGPVMMAMGAVLLHMSLDHQRRVRMAPATATVIELLPPPDVDLTENDSDELEVAGEMVLSRQDATAATRASSASAGAADNLSMTDVLLADTLSELLNVKQQLAALESKVDALSSEPKAQPAQRAELQLNAFQH
jgi:hypothetical protein